MGMKKPRREGVKMYKPETIMRCKEIYENRKDTIEHMIMFGSLSQRAEGILIKEVATAN